MAQAVARSAGHARTTVADRLDAMRLVAPVRLLTTEEALEAVAGQSTRQAAKELRALITQSARQLRDNV